MEKNAEMQSCPHCGDDAHDPLLTCCFACARAHGDHAAMRDTAEMPLGRLPAHLAKHFCPGTEACQVPGHDHSAASAAGPSPEVQTAVRQSLLAELRRMLPNVTDEQFDGLVATVDDYAERLREARNGA